MCAFYPNLFFQTSLLNHATSSLDKMTYSQGVFSTKRNRDHRSAPSLLYGIPGCGYHAAIYSCVVENYPLALTSSFICNIFHVTCCGSPFKSRKTQLHFLILYNCLWSPNQSMEISKDEGLTGRTITLTLLQ